jgi:hypothetical protein
MLSWTYNLNEHFQHESEDEAYLIVVDPQYSEGVYFNYSNPTDFFVKLLDPEGFPIVGFYIAHQTNYGVAEFDELGQLFYNEDALVSTSSAEKIITNQNVVEKFVVSDWEFLPNGDAIVWYVFETRLKKND